MIGREREISELIDLYNRKDAQLIAIYGRRRVGKTYLVDETFRGRISFRHAGISPVDLSEQQNERPMKRQLRAFYYSLINQGMKVSHFPKDWLEAFFMLEQFLQNRDDGSRQVIFLDELPWMDTLKSGFISAFESFWNSWACYRNVMVIVTGSATSWIQDKLINNHGGLYGRVTYEIKLEPFSLRECEQFFEERGIRISRYDIVQCYMIFGGIPFYLNYLQRGKSLTQNVDELFYMRGARLAQEYDRLFSSVFGNPEMMKTLVKCLSTKNSGFTRSELSKLSGYSEGGTLTNALNALIASDFVVKYIPFGKEKKSPHYKLIDQFCIFYLRFAEDSHSLPGEFWQDKITSQSVISWRGYAFENVCFNHISEIKRALGISGISSTQSAWTKTGNGEDTHGTQIDLIISRKDNVMNMCEIKFYGDVFRVDRNYDMILRRRQNLLREVIPKKCSIHNTLITTYGIMNNEYRWSFDHVITMDDLFS